MKQKQTADPIIDHGVTQLPYQRVLVVLTGTDLDTCVLRYLCLLEALGSTSQTSGVHGMAYRMLSLRAHGQDSRSDDSVGLQAGVCLPPDDKERPIVFFHTLRKGGCRALLELVAKQNIDLILAGCPIQETGSRPILSEIRLLTLRAPCPVWVVPDTVQDPKIQHIVVPMDFNIPCGEAAQVASVLAEAWQIREILALHAYFQESGFPSERSARALKDGKWQAFSECTSRLGRNAPWFKLYFEEGPCVSRVIERFAERSDADLIVMGTCQRSRWAAAVLGSTLLETIERSRIPVLVVKTGHRVSFLREVFEAMLHPKDILRTS